MTLKAWFRRLLLRLTLPLDEIVDADWLMAPTLIDVSDIAVVLPAPDGLVG